MKLLEEIQQDINKIHEQGVHVGGLSDTYHTFDELYQHRAVLTAALFRQLPFTWKAKVHDDGTMFDDMFIVGVTTPDGSATYHYDLPLWDMFKIPELPHAPEFDGHTPEEALKRIEKWFTKGVLVYSEEDLEHLNDPLEKVLNCFDTQEERDIYIRTWIKE